MESPEVELEALKSALLAHLEWQAATGAIGLPPCDSATLEVRRERYRDAVRELVPQQGDADLVAARPAAREELSFASDDVPAPAAHQELSFASDDVRAPAAHQPRHAISGQEPIDRAQHGHTAAAPTLASQPAPAPASQPAVPPQPQRPEAAAPSTPAGTYRLGDDARHRLHLLRDEVSGCTRCGLHETRTNTVFARGTERSGICFVGEGPGAEEDAQGLPFVGAAGQLLDKMIQAMGFDRDDVYICNIVKCRPPENRKPAPAEAAACREFLTEQLELLQPKVIVALGATAVTGLLGLNLGITRLRGQWRLYRGQIPVMPTFHPAYLLRQPSAKRQVWDDLKQVLTHLGLDAPPR